ncbi:hypothetical protein ACIBL8_01565 [Streptomyces sp. NPDC050523]|uniref:hypothetical protein n=1 Tax=Streptomyces sp. NPDC050523 TaxID=3365622 RepID=UPI0037924EB3
MRSTARVLSVAALASATLGFAASAALADPGAEVSPSTVSPGGSVTVSVSCEAMDGEAPAAIDATSDAFDEGTVQLQRVPRNDDKAAGPAYRGTARVSSAEDFAADDGPDGAAAQDAAQTVDGTCPAAPGGKGKPWRATFHADHGGGASGGAVPGGDDGSAAPGGDGSGYVPGGDSSVAPGGGGGGLVPGGDGADRPCKEPSAGPCADSPVQHGVQAGEGGTFTDSVPALVGGGILIAGALGAAVYRLCHRGSVLRG